MLPDVLNEVPLGRLREEPGSRWQGGQHGRKPGTEPGRRGRLGEARWTLDWMCGSAEGQVAAGGTIWSLACSGSPKPAIETFVHLSLLFYPPVTSTPTPSQLLDYLLFKILFCASSSREPVLLVLAPGTDLLGIPTGFSGHTIPELLLCPVWLHDQIHVLRAQLPICATGSHLIMNFSVLASEARYHGNKTLTQYWRKSRNLVGRTLITYIPIRASLVAQTIKNLPAKQEPRVRSLEEKMATYSSIPAWRILWTEEPGYSPWGGKS